MNYTDADIDCTYLLAEYDAGGACLSVRQTQFTLPAHGRMSVDPPESALYGQFVYETDTLIPLAAEVTLKVVDLTAKHDVNYIAEIYKEALEPEIFLSDLSIKEIALTAEEQEEVEPSSENEFGELIYEAGGATFVDGEGNTVARVTATPLDENGNPIVEEESPAEENGTPNGALPEATETEPVALPVTPGEVAEGEWTEAEPTAQPPTQSLRAARDSYTGTSPDRQELADVSLADLTASNNGSTMTEDEYNKAMADAVADSYPGKEYRLHFNAGEKLFLSFIAGRAFGPSAEPPRSVIPRRLFRVLGAYPHSGHFVKNDRGTIGKGDCLLTFRGGFFIMVLLIPFNTRLRKPEPQNGLKEWIP